MFGNTSRALQLLESINYKVNFIMAQFSDIQSHIAAQNTVEDSIITMLGSISQQLKDAQSQNDPVAVQAVIDQIDANTKKLSDAVVANTPAQNVATQTPAQVSVTPTSSAQ